MQAAVSSDPMRAIEELATGSHRQMQPTRPSCKKSLIITIGNNEKLDRDGSRAALGCAHSPRCGSARVRERVARSGVPCAPGQRSFGEYRFLEDSRYTSQQEIVRHEPGAPAEHSPLLFRPPR